MVKDGQESGALIPIYKPQGNFDYFGGEKVVEIRKALDGIVLFGYGVKATFIQLGSRSPGRRDQATSRLAKAGIEAMDQWLAMLRKAM